MKKLFSLFTIFLFLISIDPAHAVAYVNLPVPFTSEAPLGKWVDPWFNGCEEASVVMVDQYYLGKKSITSKEAAAAMMRLFNWEDETFGSNIDTDAMETIRMINEYTFFTATVKRNQTLNEIKAEIDASHPVIAPLDGVLFYAGKVYGNGYHMLVIKGYDEVNKQFIVNDDGSNTRGRDFRVSYETMMSALNDFDHATKKLSGVSTAIFTAPKQVVEKSVSAQTEAAVQPLKAVPATSPSSTATTTGLPVESVPEKIGIWERIFRFFRSLF